MSFKMKGFSLIGGTDKHKEATEKLRKSKVNLKKVANKAVKGVSTGGLGKGPKDRPQPTYEGTDEFRKEKDIPKSEFKERGIKPPGKALVGKQKNIDVNNNGKIDGDDFKQLKNKKPAPGKMIMKAAGMVIGANKRRQAAKDAAEAHVGKGKSDAMSSMMNALN